MTRMMAIVEREMRKFFRSPALMMVSMTLPLVQLVILGNAFGGKIRGARMGVVDYDRGSQALKVEESFNSIAANIRTFTTVAYNDEQKAREDVRTGKIDQAGFVGDGEQGAGDAAVVIGALMIGHGQGPCLKGVLMPRRAADVPALPDGAPSDVASRAGAAG